MTSVCYLHVDLPHACSIYSDIAAKLPVYLHRSTAGYDTVNLTHKFFFKFVNCGTAKICPAKNTHYTVAI